MQTIHDGWYTAFNIKEGVWAIDDNGQDNFYAILGSEKNMMIDNGWGGGDLPALMNRLSHRPWFTADTHFHIDHCVGNLFFDDAYIHPLDLQFLADEEAEVKQEWIRNHPEVNKHAYADFKTLSGTMGRKRTLPITDGQVFDLGNRKVTAYHIPGHTIGSVCFIDDMTRTIFMGDMYIPLQEWNELWLQIPGCAPLEAALKSIRKVISLKNDFDTVVCGHGNNYFMSVSVLYELEDALDGICSGRYQGLPVTGVPGSDRVKVYRAEHVGFVYDPENISE